MSTTDTKPFWQSKTIIAAFVTVVLSALAALGVGGIEGEKETATELIFQLITVVAGIIAIAGRITATKDLTKR